MIKIARLGLLTVPSNDAYIMVGENLAPPILLLVLHMTDGEEEVCETRKGRDVVCGRHTSEVQDLQGGIGNGGTNDDCRLSRRVYDAFIQFFSSVRERIGRCIVE